MVISVGLPLLIVKDTFKSLTSMTVEDLETFIPFLVKCSIKRAGARMIRGIPEWWVSVIRFHFPLQKPGSLSKLGYLQHLARLVYNCYCYHKAQYLLSFSSKIATDPGSVLVRNNDDNTTSVYFVQGNTDILTFNNENRFYDAQSKFPTKNSKKRLLLPHASKGAPVLDIYLCDNCDAEFSSHGEMQKHEQECYAIVIDDDSDDENISGGNEKEGKLESSNRDDGDIYNAYENGDSSSSEEIEVIKHIKPNKDFMPLKDQLFNYLRLDQTSNVNLAKLKRYAFGSPIKRRIKINEKNLIKHGKLELSSSFGQKLLENYYRRYANNRTVRNVFWYEKYCGTKLSVQNLFRRSPPEHRSSRTLRRRNERDWTHEYSFGKNQRLRRYERLKTGLNDRSLRLLKQCKELRIILTRVKLPS